MDPDRPISRLEDDRLGFAPVAEHLARAMLDQPAKQGFVFGIEGKWGSGKSTLINLTIEALKRHEDTLPEIIVFSPWLVGDRDELLRSLFDELATAASRIELLDVKDSGAQPPSGLSKIFKRDSHWKLKQKQRLKSSVGGKLEAFGVLAGTAGKLAKLGSYLGVPGAEITSNLLERGGDAAKGFLTGGSVAKRKADLVDALMLLPRRIVVFVDDLDRLEPREASEVLRLIRAVADFPNIIYALSYDPEIVAQTLAKAVQVDDGAAYLEKIVQVSFRVPRPEAYDLRRWFKSEVHKLFHDELSGAPVSQDVESRLAQAIDAQGGRYLQTGRDVVRALNALRLHGMPVRKLIDIPDMVWLQLVRIGNPTFYAWIEEYLVDIAAVSDGAGISDQESSAMSGRLETILKGENLDVDSAIFELQEILPGLEATAPTEEHISVFQSITTQSLETFISGRRLGSPNHYRFYYAFVQPSGVLPDEKVQIFIEVAGRSPSDAILMFATMSGIERPQGGTEADVLVDRLAAISERIPTNSILGILACFADTMDRPTFSGAHGDFGRHPTWEAAARATKRLLKRATSEARAEIVPRLFERGSALGWLTHIFRGEIFAHGHYGDRPADEDRWLLTATEFSDVLSIMLRRYRAASLLELSNTPDFLSLLYAWQQASGNDEVKAWVEREIATDQGLLTFLSRVRSWVASSDRGVYYPLRYRDLKTFLDLDVATKRLTDIASNEMSSDAERKTASELLVAINDGATD